MRIVRLILPLILFAALIGAPFGMGRMMDRASGHASAHQMHHTGGIKHQPLPSHDPSAPHYIVCSACVAAPVFMAEPVRIALEADAPGMMIAKTLDGTRFLPPVPPPRT